MTFIERLKCLDRLDQLIRLKATGSPRELAERLGISKRSIHNLLEDMKNLGASIYYCSQRRSYCYERELEFIYGFRDESGKQVFGGSGISNNWMQNSCIDGLYLCKDNVVNRGVLFS